MELLISIMTLLVAGIVAVLLHLLASELYDRTPSIAKKLISVAANRLPVTERTRYLEEWLAHLNECGRGLSAISHAVDCLICAASLGRILKLNGSENWEVVLHGKTIQMSAAATSYILLRMRDVFEKVPSNDSVEKIQLANKILESVKSDLFADDTNSEVKFSEIDLQKLHEFFGLVRQATSDKSGLRIEIKKRD